MNIFGLDLTDRRVLDGLKLIYAAELGIATVSELAIGALGIDKFARPLVDIQRLNAAAQTVLWGALIYQLEQQAAATSSQA